MSSPKGKLLFAILTLLLIFIAAACRSAEQPAPTPDMNTLATQMWIDLSVSQTLQAGASTPTPLPTETPLPTSTPLWVSTPLPLPENATLPLIANNPINSAEVVYVPAGEFIMGSPTTDSSRDPGSEEPQHKVYLDAFWIGKTQVTNAMYNACVTAGACQYSASQTTNPRYTDPLYANHPVVYINWYDAQTYCQWTGGRLPTEVEWEKAARGPDGRRFPWESGIPSIKYANADNLIGNTTAVGIFPYGASYYGALDMGGNVREWVSDWYDAAYFTYSPSVNPAGPETGEFKVLKGAAYLDPWKYSRPANRLSHEPDSPGAVRGFRCAYP